MTTSRRTNVIEDSSRVICELRPTVDCFHHGEVADQINMTGLAGYEIVSRSLLGIIDAYITESAKPNRKVAVDISCGESIDDAKDSEMRTYILRSDREWNKIESARL